MHQQELNTFRNQKSPFAWWLLDRVTVRTWKVLTNVNLPHLTLWPLSEPRTPLNPSDPYDCHVYPIIGLKARLGRRPSSYRLMSEHNGRPMWISRPPEKIRLIFVRCISVSSFDEITHHRAIIAHHTKRPSRMLTPPSNYCSHLNWTWSQALFSVASAWNQPVFPICTMVNIFHINMR